ncbi:MAG TPA: hypothetical protein VGP64_01560 [Polyangia bacterium]
MILLCHGVAGAATRRLAQAPDPAGKITQLNRDALGAIDKREFEKAREILKKALELCETSGLAQHAVAARTHVHMGVVIIEGFKNRELGEKQFAAALAIEPGIAMTPALATPEINEAFDEAKETAKNGATPGGEASGGDAVAAAPDSRPAAAPARAGAGSGGFTYHTVSEVKQGNAIRVTVNVDENLKFHKVVLAYRPQGTSEFLGRAMDPVGPGAYSAEIPDHATTGSSVAYYIEADDDDGQPVANRGTEERPLVIQLGGASHPTERAHAAVAEKKGDGDGDDDSTTVREEGEAEETSHPWFVGVLVGSGVGYTSGNGETNANLPVSGAFAATSLGHVAPEIGYWVRPDLLLSLQGRIQVVSGPTELVDPMNTTHVYQPAGWALAAFAKASMFFGSGDLRPFISGGLGAGQIRHVVTFGAYTDCGAARNQTCVDSVVAGPALAEAGAGLLYTITPTFGLEAGTNMQIAEPKFTFNIDFNGGVAVSF